MSHNNSEPNYIIQNINSKCQEKGYQIEIKEHQDFIRIRISDKKNIVLLNLYSSGKWTVGGTGSPLREEFKEYKKEFDQGSTIINLDDSSSKKGRTATYQIISSDINDTIKNGLKNSEGFEEFEDNPRDNIEYWISVKRNNQKLKITKFKSGSLLLQGKDDSLFEEICSLIEKTAPLPTQEIVSRFLPEDEKKQVEKCTPELITKAESIVKSNLGEAFDFLEEHDKTYYISSECLRLSDIQLPEYSPIIMPAAKGYEGFTRKLMVSIGIVEKNHFSGKSCSTGVLNDKTNPKRVSICSIKTHFDDLLTRMSSNLLVFRHHMLHSEEGQHTRISEQHSAGQKLDSLYYETKFLYDGFNESFHFLNERT